MFFNKDANSLNHLHGFISHEPSRSCSTRTHRALGLGLEKSVFSWLSMNDTSVSKTWQEPENTPTFQSIPWKAKKPFGKIILFKIHFTFFLCLKISLEIISGLFFMFLKGHFDARFYWLASKKLVRWPPYWPLRIVVTILVLSLLKITDYEVDAFDAFDTNNQFSSFDLVLKFAFINKVLKSAREENKTNFSFLSSEYRIFFFRQRTW